jgi:ribose/xylose/arabinose/galactoside ABC-type transport system permease subunit
LAGLTAAMAGVLMAERLNFASPNYRFSWDLAAIAAAAIDEASLAGGNEIIILRSLIQLPLRSCKMVST